MSHPTSDELELHRPALFGLAYRMLGSVMDAEDVVQEAFIRWQSTADADIQSPRAYLVTIVTRLCLDHLRLARVQRESYVGMWLPEPWITSSEDDPARMVELDESITTAFLLLLERLSPQDRAVFLLHEVFNYTFTEIAAIIGRSPAGCRQIGHRARERLIGGRPRFSVEAESVESVVRGFLQACIEGDLAALMTLLDTDVTVTVDSGGKVSAVRNRIVGVDRTARLFIGLFRRWPEFKQYNIRVINGQCALVMCRGERVIGVTTFEVQNQKITQIFEVLNPEKLVGLKCESSEPM